MWCGALVASCLLAAMSSSYATSPSFDASVGLLRSEYSVIEGKSLQVCAEVITTPGMIANDTDLTLSVTDQSGKQKSS